jgi:glycosyltransferase involved in cell wall biosynthesis
MGQAVSGNSVSHQGKRLSRRLCRLAFVTRTLDFGGLQRHLIDLIARLDLGRVEASILCLGKDPAYSEVFKDEVRVRIKSGLEIDSVSDWLRLFLQTKPDVTVFVHGDLCAFSWKAYLAARIVGHQVYSIHHLIPPPLMALISGNSLRARARRIVGYRRRHHLAVRLCGKLANTHICVSNKIRERLLEDYGYPSNKTITIHNGVSVCPPDEKPIDSAHIRQALKIGPGEIVIVCVARLSREKRLDVLLSAMSGLIRGGYNCKCIIVGDGPLKESLSQMVLDLNLGSAVFLIGFKKDVRPYLKTGDIFVLASDREGLPLAILEAMACGLPCVVTDIAGNPEAVAQNKTGLLVSPGSVADLTSAIMHLLDRPCERRAMGANGQIRARMLFDLDAKMREIETVILGSAFPRTV